MHATAISQQAQELFFSNGVLVLEGVAGIGKSYAIKEAQSLLANGLTRQATNSDRTQSLLDLMAVLTPETALDTSGVRDGWKGDIDAWLTRPVIVHPPAEVRVLKCVMHPSTSYEEFIGGLRPIPGPDFDWLPGTFTRFLQDAQRAHNCKDKTRFLVVLDEINRCNLPSVLGELMYLIDPSRRVAEVVTDEESLENKCFAVVLHESADKQPVAGTSPVADTTPVADTPLKKIVRAWIPTNLFILGTMNSSDRSILGFDQALRRRFPPFRLEPFKVEDFRTYCTDHGATLPDYAGDLDPAIASAAEVFCHAVYEYAALNCLLRFLIGCDAMIGHSYLLQALANAGFPKKGGADAFDGMDSLLLQKEIKAAWRFGILPQVIHAAEATRQEQLAEALTVCCTDQQTKELERLCDTYLPDKSNVETFDPTVARLMEAIEAVGLKSLGDYEKLKQEENSTAATDNRQPDLSKVLRNVFEKIYSCVGKCKTRDTELTVTGYGHGQRLLVIDKAC